MTDINIERTYHGYTLERTEDTNWWWVIVAPAPPDHLLGLWPDVTDLERAIRGVWT